MRLNRHTELSSNREAIQRLPSAAARDQHPLMEQSYLRRTLSRRQLQGFVL
jgi:hypothetical protein